MKYIFLFFAGILAIGCVTQTGDDDDMQSHSFAPKPGAPIASQQGWSKVFDLKAGNSQRDQVQKNFEFGSEFTVQFGSPSVPKNSAGNAVKVLAIVTWFTAGNQIVRQISVSQGGSISGVAESVNVTLIDQTPNDSGFAAPNTVYTMGVGIVPGVRPNIQQPALYSDESFQVTMAAGTVHDVAIPQGIGVISVILGYRSNNGPYKIGDLSVIFSDSAGVGVSVWDPIADPGFFPVPTGAVTMRLLNNSDLGAAPDNIDFDISWIWGIDG